jgi:hypothetical protein
MTTTAAEVYLDNDHEFRYRLTRAASTTGTTEAAAALSSVSAHFSETDGGAAIAGTSTTLTERSAKPGSYFGILDRTDLNTALAAFANRRLFEVFVVAGDAETSEPVIVKTTRRPG